MSRHVDRTACALLLVLTACGRGPDVGGGPEAATWSRRLRADAPTRDGALVELRKKREAGVPSVLALLDDPEIARTEGHAAIREELVYILGEGGTTSVEAQRRLERLLADPGSDVGEALAAARGLVLSWRMGREVPILEAYIALLRRVTRAEDARMATSVSALALSGGRFPYEPAYVAALRAGTAHPKSCAFCVGALRRFSGHEAEFVDLFRSIGERLESAPRSDDPAEEAEKLALREVVATAIAESDPK